MGESDDAGDDIEDLRILTRKKANYARTGEEIVLRWHDWAFFAERGAGALEQMHRQRGEVTSGESAPAEALAARRLDFTRLHVALEVPGEG